MQRLGFRCTDRFTGVGPFLQPAGTLDHHTHFFIGAPAFMKGCEHFTFHFGGPTEVLHERQRASSRRATRRSGARGATRSASNWFWYFNSPFGCHMEMDADMDLHDDHLAAARDGDGRRRLAGLPARATARSGRRGPARRRTGDYA